MYTPQTLEKTLDHINFLVLGANEALYEPLIPLQHEDEDVPVRNEGQPSTSGQVVPYGYPDVSAWLLNLTIFCTDTWNWLYGTWMRIPRKSGATTLMEAV